MTIELAACIIVGLPREELEDLGWSEDQYHELETAGPYSDRYGNPKTIMGFPFVWADNLPTELDLDGPELLRLKTEFYELTGKEGRVFLTTDLDYQN